MIKYRNGIFYFITIAGFSGLIWLILHNGIHLEGGKVAQFVPQITASTWHQFTETFLQNITHPLALLLLQIITIILVARILGLFCKKIGQPSVIGEIIAGILLGPSFAGTFLPGFSTFLFPAQSLGNLQFLSQKPIRSGLTEKIVFPSPRFLDPKKNIQFAALAQQRM